MLVITSGELTQVYPGGKSDSPYTHVNSLTYTLFYFICLGKLEDVVAHVRSLTSVNDLRRRIQSDDWYQERFTLRGLVWLVREKVVKRYSISNESYAVCSFIVSDENGHLICVTVWDVAAEVYSRCVKVWS
jgi:hypothetical protein